MKRVEVLGVIMVATYASLSTIAVSRLLTPPASPAACQQRDRLPAHHLPLGVPGVISINNGAERGVDVMRILKRFSQDDSGATAIEYGLIAALIAVAIVAAARALGSQIGDTFNTVTSTMKSA